MSKNRTLQSKRWKMENQAKRYALGDHARFSPNPLSTPGTDDRDGRLQSYNPTLPSHYLAPPNSKAQLREMLNTLDCDQLNHVVVKICKPRKAKGLEKDYGNSGKGGNHAWQKTFGNGERIKQGITMWHFAE